MVSEEKKYVCIREKELNKHDTEIAKLKTRSVFKEEKINELSESMREMDKKLDHINDSIQELKLQSAQDDFNIDNRVKALESKLETLKWVTGSAVAILSVLVAILGFVMTFIH